MQLILSSLAVLLLLATSARADTTSSDKVNAPTEDCSKQVWPNFTPSCLRSAGHITPVRILSTERR